MPPKLRFASKRAFQQVQPSSRPPVTPVGRTSAWFLCVAALLTTGCLGRISPDVGTVCDDGAACAGEENPNESKSMAESCSGDDCPEDGDDSSDQDDQDDQDPTPMAGAMAGGMYTGDGMCLSPVTRPETSRGSGFFVADGNIYDPNGCQFVPFGFNGAVFWNVEVDGSRGQHPEAHKGSFADMGAAGANAVRIVTQTAGSFGWNSNPETQRELVELAVENRLVPILEMHNATCGEQPIEPIRTYWESTDMVQLAQDFEDTMWINIANEADFESPEKWRDFYAATIKSLRERDVNNLIVLDAGARCGQDPEAILKYGQEILDGDPNHNVVFSFHMYGYWRTEECPRCGEGWTPPFKVEEDFKALRDTGLAIFIGEFGWDAVEDASVLYDPQVVVQTAEELGIGWTFWSWYEENPNYQAVNDLTQPDDLTQAGEFLLPYIRSIAQPATHMAP